MHSTFSTPLYTSQLNLTLISGQDLEMERHNSK